MYGSLTSAPLETVNRAFLAEWDPLLLSEIEGHAPQGELVPGPKGTSLRMGADIFHDLEDPAAEARAVMGRAHCGLHLHFGFGLGHWLAADQPADHGLTLIYEPCPGFVQHAIRHLPLEALFRRTRARLCCSFARFRYLFLKYHACYGSNQLFISRYHARYFTDAFGDFGALIDRQHAELQVKTTNRLYSTVLRSTLAALPAHVQSPGWELWRDRLAGKPALIIGAGPSLDKNIAQLLPQREKFLIFAVARAAAVLEAHGIAPDFLVHVEAQDFRGFIQGCENLRDTIFLLADQTHPYYYTYPHGHTFVFQSRTNPIVNSLVARHPETRREVVKTGGSVATAAFYLAFLAGCNPLVLLGQDFALGTASTYAGGERDHKSGEMRRTVTGYFGGQVTTLANYHTNIVWYERSLPLLRQQDPQRRFINATEGGALLPGFERMSLRHVLYELPRQSVSFAVPETAASPGLSAAELATFLAEMTRFCRDMAQLREGFQSIEERLLRQLSRAPEAELDLDPAPVLEALISHLRQGEHFEELCRGEFGLAKLLAKRQGRGAQDLLRTWAGLAAIHQGLAELELLASACASASG